MIRLSITKEEDIDVPNPGSTIKAQELINVCLPNKAINSAKSALIELLGDFDYDEEKEEKDAQV